MNAEQRLVRYGTIPQVEQFHVEFSEPISRGTQVVIRTERGEELGELLQEWSGQEVTNQEVADKTEEAAEAQAVLRIASEDELQRSVVHQEKCETDFTAWQKRIVDWGLELELVDLEKTLDDELLILYVLNDRGPDCTKLALRVSAEGLGNVKVQPVDTDGPVAVSAAVGTGSCSSGGSCGCRS